MDQISSDELPNMQGAFLNKAKNQLSNLIADGEARMYKKIYGSKKQVDGGYVHGWDAAHKDGNCI